MLGDNDAGGNQVLLKIRVLNKWICQFVVANCTE
jgi:hypothetical protein